MKGVQLTKLVQELGLHNLTPEIDLSEIVIKTAEINRPALQLTGYLEHFANERVQIIGYVEYTYLMQLSDEERKFKYERFISSKIPCVIFSTMTRPSQDMIDLAVKYNVPTFVTERTTSSFMAEIIRWLGVQLAPCISIHGVLVDVYGEGVLITGESGIGKSEAALELIKRGHRLVSDDVVELRKVSDVTLVGSAPDITRHFIELRGIGIIDVKTLFGVESVKDTQSVDLVIKLEEWDRDKEYDRLGLHEEYTEYLGNKIVCHSLPIRPGRNLAIIVESAAVNHRQKKMGYNAAKALYTNQLILNTDPERITIIGDSAGGNLTAAVCLMARDKGEFTPRRQILIYPALGNCYTEESPYRSVQENGSDYLLTSVKMEDYLNLYQSSAEDRQNPYFAPILEKDLRNLPETLILTAEYDPLRDEGEVYGRKLHAAGNHVEVHRIYGAFHGFFALGIKFLHVQESFKYINRFLNKSYEKILQ